ncbi:MAG: SLC13 family permease [Planctomycetaceae bacterium]|nr:SLC13 family permease [Planctomycetaceae bacterium]
MSFDAWLTVAVVAAVFVAMIRNVAPTDLTFVTGTCVLAMAGVITPEEAFAGFSNQGMLTVAFLFVVAAALRETGVLDFVGGRLLGGAATIGSVLRRLSLVVIPSSAFLNNTPIVAMFMPVLLDWSRRRRVSPSKLLIPLSYLSILGGTCTLIGTSTNLVVHGLMVKNGMQGMGLFELGKVGLPYAIVGVAYLLVVGPRLLPDRTDLLEKLGQTRREYVTEMQVAPGGALVGRTIENAGLRHLPGLFLVEIQRNERVISPAGPGEVLQAADQLVFAGVVASVVELQNIPGLTPPAEQSLPLAPHERVERRLCEVVISSNSRLVGQTIRDADFRTVYGAAVVAVHRGGSRVATKIGDIRLEAGDTLLLQTPPHFARAHRNDPAFYLVSAVDDYRPLRTHRARLAVPLFVALIAAMALDLAPTALAAALIAAAMVGAGCISAGEARRSIEWQVLATIAAAFGMGTAIQKSGLAAAAGEALVQATESLGPVAALACVYVLGSVLTELVTNNAVAVLLFPICVEVARFSHSSPRPFLMALALAASASFMTPIGYQTNLMVYGPGGYRFGDFLRIGVPLNLILAVLAIVLIPWAWPF